MRVLNEVGREMVISEPEYNNLVSMGLKFTVLEEEVQEKVEEKEHKRIGVFLQRHCTKEPFCASDRIRGEWVMKFSNNMEEYEDGVDYEAVIFHYASDKIKKTKGVKILDICDEVWKGRREDFLNNIATVDAIVVPTEGLKNSLSEITSKRIHVIPDGHDFDHYSGKVENKHDKKANTVVWFGYSKNFHPVEPLLDIIKSLKLKLKVISDLPVEAGEFKKWNVETYIKEISKCDFAILPKNGDYKSDNKTITALLSGIPVAKTEEDIKRLVKPSERKKDMKKVAAVLPSYHASIRTNEYEKLIESIKRTRPVIYTAVHGNYEKKRDDIVVFSDKIDDKFKQSVMNAKVYKVLPHRFLDCEYSVWVDGNIFPVVSSGEIKELLGNSDIAVFRHPQRNCVYQESFPARERVAEEYRGLIREQMDKYESEGFPAGFGLWECGMIIRKHNEATREFNERWWAEITRFSQRDQLSFPYVMWKMQGKIKLKTLDGNVRNHKYFRYENHGN